MYWGFKKSPFTVYTYVLAKILQNGAKFIQLITGFKNYMSNLDNFRQAEESPKSLNLMVNFDLSAQVSKICTLIDPSRAKYITFDLKKYKGITFHVSEEPCKI